MEVFILFCLIPNIVAFTGRLPISKVYRIAHSATVEPSISINERAAVVPKLETLQHILSVAEAAAKDAGRLIKENIGARVKYSKTNYKVILFT